jgi:hypothetical protein
MSTTLAQIFTAFLNSLVIYTYIAVFYGVFSFILQKIKKTKKQKNTP